MLGYNCVFSVTDSAHHFICEDGGNMAHFQSLHTFCWSSSAHLYGLSQVYFVNFPSALTNISKGWWEQGDQPPWDNKACHNWGQCQSHWHENSPKDWAWAVVCTTKDEENGFDLSEWKNPSWSKYDSDFHIRLFCNA